MTINQHDIITNTNDVGPWALLRHQFYAQAIAEEPAFLTTVGWNTDVSFEFTRGDLGGAYVYMGEDPDKCHQVYGKTHDEVSYFLSQNGAEVSVILFGNDKDLLDKFVEDLLKRAPKRDNKDRSTVPISFWSLNSHGDPQEVNRRVDSHHWDDIKGNYPISSRVELQELMDLSPPEKSGKLILWHGPPGTGKTNCIRALADAWRDWATVDYIVDPEELFRRAHYMMSTLVAGSSNKWRLVIIEDSGDFLREDAMDRSGSGFSRLLNLADGLVGQGLKLIVLITTNEPFDDLHPAVARPGRCLARMSFDPFPADEASAWLQEKVTEKMTLAEMYERKREISPSEVHPQIKVEKPELDPVGIYL